MDEVGEDDMVIDDSRSPESTAGGGRSNAIRPDSCCGLPRAATSVEEDGVEGRFERGMTTAARRRVKTGGNGTRTRGESDDLGQHHFKKRGQKGGGGQLRILKENGGMCGRRTEWHILREGGGRGGRFCTCREGAGWACDTRSGGCRVPS